MKHVVRILSFAILISFLSNSCSPPSGDQVPVLRIGISKAVPVEKYKNYINWIKATDSSVVTVDLYSLGLDSALAVLETLDGLLVTGGEDINPELYGKEFDSTRVDDPNHYRDSLDYQLIDKAVNMNMPLMAICRGLQMLNVYFGGTLIFDIPMDFDTTVKHRYPPYKTSEHNVILEENSFLREVSGIDFGMVNSNHHQGIEIAGNGLHVVARTDDGLPEAIELSDPWDESFMLGVQWHPERMDYSNPLSGQVARRFLSEAKKFAKR